MAAPDERCARIARMLQEPMAGTAPSTRRWLCLERPGPWSRDITQDPDPIVQAVLSRAAAADFRPLLIRGRAPGPNRGGPIRLLLADTAADAAVLTTLTVERPEQLDDLPLPEPDGPLPGEPVSGPLLLVCTHAERDRCCGVDGRALIETLDGPDVLECSHLGGHRFAPTAMVLPTGYVYGHLDPVSAAAIHARAKRGEVTVDRCRGRCTWTPRGQVAELAVRAATGLRSPDDLLVDDGTGEAVHVRTASGERWAVDLELPDVEVTRPVSCGSRPTLMAPLQATAVRALA